METNKLSVSYIVYNVWVFKVVFNTFYAVDISMKYYIVVYFK